MEIVVQEERVKQLETEGTAIVSAAKAFAIVKDDSQRDAGLTFVRGIREKLAIVEALLGEPIDHAHKLHKSLCDRRNALEKPLQQAEKLVKGSCADYEIRKKDELERQRQAELAEQRKRIEEVEHERKRIIEAARVAEEKERQDRATQAIADGVDQSIVNDFVIDAPIEHRPVELPPMPKPMRIETPEYIAPKAANVRVTWKARIVDESQIPREWMTPDVKKIDAYVRAQGDKANIPGVIAEPVSTMAMRG